MDFSIAVPTFNRGFILKKNLEILISQVLNSKYQGEILILDDASNDNTPQILDSLKKEYPEIIRTITNPRNKGISYCRNKLVSEAKGEIIIFIDSDVIVSENTIEEHLKVIDSEKKVISQGILILISELNEVENKTANPLTDYSTAFFETANVAIKREAIIQAGYFDENFRAYGWEDLEMGLRLKKSGFRLFRNKKARAFHYHPQEELSNLENSIRKETDRAKGAIYFYQKHPVLSVKLMTQISSLHFFMDYLLDKILGFEDGRFYKYLHKTSKKNIHSGLLRIYLNHYNIKELKRLIKHKNTKP